MFEEAEVAFALSGEPAPAPPAPDQVKDPVHWPELVPHPGSELYHFNLIGEIRPRCVNLAMDGLGTTELLLVAARNDDAGPRLKEGPGDGEADGARAAREQDEPITHFTGVDESHRTSVRGPLLF